MIKEAISPISMYAGPADSLLSLRIVSERMTKAYAMR